MLLSLALVGCQKQAAAPAPAPPLVTVSLPLNREVNDWDEYTGHLVSPQTANIAARISGIIEASPFKEGALVKKGDVLFVIDDRPFKADLDNKKATLAKDLAQVALTRAQLSRSEDLIKKKAIAQQDFDTSKAGFDQANAQLAADQAAVDTAQLNLDWTRVTAPIDGRVSKINVTVGNLVNGGAGQATLLTTIVSVDPMYCYVSVPERSFLKYQAYAEKSKGESVREAKIPCFVKLENEKNYPHEGVIDFIDNNVDPNTGTIQLRGVIPNSNGELTPGLFAQMRITGSGPYKTLLVPDIAVGAEQNERFLMVVEKDNTVAVRKVQLGELFGSLRSITDGLKPDERVIVNGLQLVRPGGKVTPQDAPISADSIAALEASSSGLASARSAPGSTPAPAKAKP
ncbi:MAG: efflux RND transporter periplasmic adaptor subunit [Chthoniobacter sp.]|nr:efflux RND transporter periplasmic adaptor subunit [Chthoniobacter sp.]